VEIYIELSQESSHWAKIQNLDIVQYDFVRSGVSVKDFKLVGSLERCRTLSGLARQYPAGRVCFGKVERDLALLFSLHSHVPLNSTVFLYSRNIKKTH
jgi:hypothetical protein